MCVNRAVRVCVCVSWGRGEGRGGGLELTGFKALESEPACWQGCPPSCRATGTVSPAPHSAPCCRVPTHHARRRPAPPIAPAVVEEQLFLRAVLRACLGALTPGGIEARARHAVAERLLAAAATSAALGRVVEATAARRMAAASPVLAAVHAGYVAAGVLECVLPAVLEELAGAEADADADDDAWGGAWGQPP